MEVFYGKNIYKWAIYTMAMLVITRGYWGLELWHAIITVRVKKPQVLAMFSGFTAVSMNWNMEDSQQCFSHSHGGQPQNQIFTTSYDHEDPWETWSMAIFRHIGGIPTIYIYIYIYGFGAFPGPLGSMFWVCYDKLLLIHIYIYISHIYIYIHMFLPM